MHLRVFYAIKTYLLTYIVLAASSVVVIFEHSFLVLVCFSCILAF